MSVSQSQIRDSLSKRMNKEGHDKSYRHRVYQLSGLMTSIYNLTKKESVENIFSKYSSKMKDQKWFINRLKTLGLIGSNFRWSGPDVESMVNNRKWNTWVMDVYNEMCELNYEKESNKMSDEAEINGSSGEIKTTIEAFPCINIRNDGNYILSCGSDGHKYMLTVKGNYSQIASMAMPDMDDEE